MNGCFLIGFDTIFELVRVSSRKVAIYKGLR
uniref:Uncharacterized protein n=1 Tax=Siphoviridae sp. ctr2f5 TaxID=2825684 RepID=A0A8S5QEL6_9CAUD|nr:MAG TPA: hypothetical protein [Siphoviridae sp. ctr2f5]